MLRTDSKNQVIASVFDRLLVETTSSHFRDDLSMLKQSVMRDLSWLLNTRQTDLKWLFNLDDKLPQKELQKVLEEAMKRWEAVNRSLLTYGLPDFGQLGINNSADRERMRRALEEAITRFEPRLGNVRVEEKKEDAKEKQEKSLVTLSLGFVVTAELKADPTPVPVEFETVLDLRNGKYEVTDGKG